MQKSATISDCGKFRYRLGRRWADGPVLLFVMFNPSTADAEQDDPTIRRCIRFAQAEGYGAIDVVNLFAFRATDPKELRRFGYQVGPENDAHIQAAARDAGAACLAWGVNAADLARPQWVLPLLRSTGVKLCCLRITRSGHPQRPSAAPADASQRLQTHVVRQSSNRRRHAWERSMKKTSMVIAKRAAIRRAGRIALAAQAESIICAGVKVPAAFSDWGATRTECFTMLAHHFQKRLGRLKPSDELKHPRSERVCMRILEEAAALRKISSMPLERCMQIIADGDAVDYLEGASE